MRLPAVFLRQVGLFVASKVASSKTGRGIVAKDLRGAADYLDRDTVESVNRRLAESERLQKRTLYIAALALAIAIGHVVYAIIPNASRNGRCILPLWPWPSPSAMWSTLLFETTRLMAAFSRPGRA